MVSAVELRTDARRSGSRPPASTDASARGVPGVRGHSFDEQSAMLAPDTAGNVQMLASRDDEAAPHHGAPAPVVQRKQAGKALDKDAIAADGAASAELPPAKIKAAIAANEKRWKGGYKVELLTFLRGSAGGGPGFTEADVKAAAALQAGAGTGADGIIGDATMAVFLHAGLEFSDQAAVDKAHPTGKVRASEVKLEFWPGELEDMAAWKAAIAEANQIAADNKAAGSDDEAALAPMRNLTAPPGEGRIYVRVGGNVVAKYAARGGPPAKILDIGGHTADPTQGTYTVGAQQKGFTTKAWPASQIGWDAKIRKGDGGAYEYAPAGTKKFLPVPANIQGDIDWYWSNDKLNPDPDDPEARRYNQNDFGAMAYRLTGSPGFYIHTTPETELQAAEGQPVELTHSHGCVHVDPSERDAMIARGYLQPGVTFACKKYDANLLPKVARDKLM